MERIESDPNPFPKIDILCLCSAIGSRVRGVIELGRVTEPCLSNHIRREPKSNQLTLDL